MLILQCKGNQFYIILKKDRVHADEQGLGKTVQAIALIVMEPPSLEDAADALAEAERMESNAALHPESAEARAARAAGAGVFMPDQPNGAGANVPSANIPWIAVSYPLHVACGPVLGGGLSCCLCRPCLK